MDLGLRDGDKDFGVVYASGREIKIRSMGSDIFLLLQRCLKSRKNSSDHYLFCFQSGKINIY